MSFEQLNDLHYTVVNKDKMKLPVGGRLSNLDEITGTIAVKFITNPFIVSSKDDLFDILQPSVDTPTKYFFMLNK